MKSASGTRRVAALVTAAAVSGFLGLLLAGCAPAPQDQQGPVDNPPVETPPGVTAEPAAAMPESAVPEESTASPPEMPSEEAPKAEEAPKKEEMTPPAVETPKEPAAEKPAASPAEKEKSEAPAAKPAAATPKETPKEPPKEMSKPAAAAPAEKAAGASKTEEKPAKEAASKNAFVAAGAAIDPSKVSTYAPAKDLASQVKEYLDELNEAVESEDEYADSWTKLAKDANTLILIALALGLNDEDSQYKKAAPALVKAAQKLATDVLPRDAAAGGSSASPANAGQDEGPGCDYATAKADVEAVEKAAASTDGDPSTLKWEKVASLPELMKAVPLINSRLKRYIRGSRFKSKTEVTLGLTAVLAVVGQGSMSNVGETEQPTEVEKWHAFCAQLRDAAATVHATIVAQDEAAKDKAMENLQQSCDDCHAVFHPEELANPTPDSEN